MTISHSAEENRTRVSLGAQMFTRGGEQITLSRPPASTRFATASTSDPATSST
jgi:hypothetical protein